jgi:formylmethanofuran dehydrogenase subunit E
MISLKEAKKFHGHLGPWLVLGILTGKFALKKIKAKKYFGIKVKVYGANKKPTSCLVDGLQLSTGATYGKGNIQKLNGPEIRIEFLNQFNRKKVAVRFKKCFLQRLREVKTHRDSELLAKKLYKEDSELSLLTIN